MGMVEGGEPGSLVGIGVCHAIARPDPTTGEPSTPEWADSPSATCRGTVQQRAESASAILGPAHPPVGAIKAVAVAARQWRVCAAMLAGASIAQLEGHPWARGLAITAGIVLLAITVLIAALMARVRDCAAELIAEGRETLPVAVVQRQRDRLLTRRRRETLARTLDTMVGEATTPPKIRTTATRPLFDPIVIAGVAAELRAVTARLQTEPAHARGVALTEKLVTDGGSPLYGDCEKRLREKLRSLCSVLDECPTQSPKGLQEPPASRRTCSADSVLPERTSTSTDAPLLLAG